MSMKRSELLPAKVSGGVQAAEGQHEPACNLL